MSNDTTTLTLIIYGVASLTELTDDVLAALEQARLVTDGQPDCDVTVQRPSDGRSCLVFVDDMSYGLDALDCALEQQLMRASLAFEITEEGRFGQVGRRRDWRPDWPHVRERHHHNDGALLDEATWRALRDSCGVDLAALRRKVDAFFVDLGA